MVNRLSKSRLQSYAQCPKRLWLELHARELAEENEASQLIFDRGNAFGKAVRHLFAGGEMIDTLDTQEALELTGEYLAAFNAGQTRLPLFEAAFQFRNVLVRVDILEPQSDGNWRLIEVKSGKIKAGKAPKDAYIRDAAIQAFVLENCGLTISAIELGTPSTDFTLTELNNFEGLMARHDITTEARKLFGWVATAIEEAFATADMAEVPDIKPDEKCTIPYSCPFIRHCTATKLSPGESIRVPVWHLAGSPTTKLVQELMTEYRDLANVPEDRLSVPMHRIMGKIARNEILNWVDTNVRDWLRKQPFPRYFLDYEFISSPLPIWTGTRAGERIAFQASLHVWHSPDVQAEHYAFIAESRNDPRPQLAEALAEWMRLPGPVFAWGGKSVEGPITEGLAAFHQAGASVLQRVADSCRENDPLPIFRKGFYLPAMEGDWGLKSVSTALLGENRYATLRIRNGVEAIRGYEKWVTLPEGSERDELKEGLLEYCNLDTSIMIDVWNATLNLPTQSAA